MIVDQRTTFAAVVAISTLLAVRAKAHCDSMNMLGRRSNRGRRRAPRFGPTSHGVSLRLKPGAGPWCQDSKPF